MAEKKKPQKWIKDGFFIYPAQPYKNPDPGFARYVEDKSNDTGIIMKPKSKGAFKAWTPKSKSKSKGL